jgi:hypothetical protein
VISVLVIVSPFVHPELVMAVQGVIDADARINGSSEGQNNGSADTLAVRASGGGRKSFMRFDFSTLPARASVQEAALSLFVDSVASGGSGCFEVRTVSPGVGTPTNPLYWSELNPSGLNWTNGNALIGGAGTPRPLLSTHANNFVTVDITPLVQGWLVNPASNNRLALVPSSACQWPPKESHPRSPIWSQYGDVTGRGAFGWPLSSCLSSSSPASGGPRPVSWCARRGSSAR